MMTIGELLLHKQVQTVMERVTRGDPPKLIAAQLAGDLVAQHLAKKLGVAIPDPKVVEVKKGDENVVDAEFREIK